MTLDEIMEKEKFNEVEKALVNHYLLSHADKVKIISDIKTAKSNDLQSDRIIILTYGLFFISVMDILSRIKFEKGASLWQQLYTVAPYFLGMMLVQYAVFRQPNIKSFISLLQRLWKALFREL